MSPLDGDTLRRQFRQTRRNRRSHQRMHVYNGSGIQAENNRGVVFGLLDRVNALRLRSSWWRFPD